MNDAEWEAWSKQWASAAGALPDVQARARREASRRRWTTAVYFGVLGAGALADAWAVLFDHADPWTCLGLLVWAVAVVGAIAWVQRGSRLRDDAGPREALAFLERQVKVERQAAQVLRWSCTVGALVVAVYFRDLFGDDWVVKLLARAVVFAIAAAIFAAPWWMRPFIRRQEVEAQHWRRWLDEQQL